MNKIFNPKLYIAKRWDSEQLNIFKPGLLVGYGVDEYNWVIKVIKVSRHITYIEGDIVYLGTARNVKIGKSITIDLDDYTHRGIFNPIWIITSKDSDNPKTRFSILR